MCAPIVYDNLFQCAVEVLGSHTDYSDGFAATVSVSSGKLLQTQHDAVHGEEGGPPKRCHPRKGPSEECTILHACIHNVQLK